MKILLDMDNVICKWVDRVLENYNHDHGTSFEINDITEFNFFHILGTQGKPHISAQMDKFSFWANLEPVDGAIEGIQQLIHKGFEVFIVTDVSKDSYGAYPGKVEWLKRNMPFFDLRNFIACSKKEMVDGDVLFDDGAHNIESFVNNGGIGVLFDYPWNQGDVELSFRARNWKDFLDYVGANNPMNE